MLSAFLSLSGLKKTWPQLSEDEVRRHNTRNSLWIISGNSVYDVTDILYSHPGGDLALLRRGGGSRDCAKDQDFHSRYARRQWAIRKVGEVAAPSDEDDDSAPCLSTTSSWCEECGYAEEEEDNAARAGWQENQQTAAKDKSDVLTATVKVSGSRAGGGAAMQPSLEGGPVCMCARCCRLTE